MQRMRLIRNDFKDPELKTMSSMSQMMKQTASCIKQLLVYKTPVWYKCGVHSSKSQIILCNI